MGSDANSDNLCNSLSMFRFNDSSRFSDCVLIIDLETRLKFGRRTEGGFMETDMDSSRVLKLHVNSTVLAGQSPFFRDLLTNATMESGHRCVALTIHDSVEAAVMELLNYMHGGTLTATSEPALLEVLKLADKFQVVSCLRLCASSLMKMPMTGESALVYLSLLAVDDEQVRHLVDAAKQYVATQPTDTYEHLLEIMKLSLAGIEAVFSSDFLEAESEDRLFQLALNWTKAHYPDFEDQRRIFSTRLARYIRFPYMSPWMLREKVLSCDVLDGEFASKVVADALFFRVTTPLHHYHRDAKAIEGSTPTSHRPYVRRPYYEPLVKVVEFEFPCQEVAVYFDVAAPVSSLCLEEFKCIGYWFRLVVSAVDGKDMFGVYLESDDDNLNEPLALEYEFAARSERTGGFVLKSSGSLEFRHYATVYETPLLDFRAGKSLDFIDGVVYVEFKLRGIVQ